MMVSLLLAAAYAQESPASAEAAAAFDLGSTLLAQEQYGGAIEQFKLALRYDPTHAGARDSLATACVRLAARFEMVGDLQSARSLYSDALAAKPALADDPVFAERMRAVNSPEARAVPIYEKDEDEVEKVNPRAGKVLGGGISFGLDGFVGLQAGVRFARLGHAAVTFGTVFQTIDVTIHLMVLPERKWSPYAGLGYVWGYPDWSGEQTRMGFLHADGGVEMMSRSGYTWRMGATLASFDTDMLLPLPSTSFSWYFGTPKK